MSMDRGQFIEIGAFDIDAVNLETAPQSAEHYLQQVPSDFRIAFVALFSVFHQERSSACRGFMCRHRDRVRGRLKF